ncbi:MAG TPA: hypothetical protein VK445_08270, partial [Dissulfurispiraceae bacterium]|nr:hypothetical protein [Dissulfurispiraceae bacterium]
MKEHHPILRGQIETYIGNATPLLAFLKSFLDSINSTYWQLQDEAHNQNLVKEVLHSANIYKTIF